jgi:hypothetical protein
VGEVAGEGACGVSAAQASTKTVFLKAPRDVQGRNVLADADSPDGNMMRGSSRKLLFGGELWPDDLRVQYGLDRPAGFATLLHQ